MAVLVGEKSEVNRSILANFIKEMSIIHGKNSVPVTRPLPRSAAAPSPKVQETDSTPAAAAADQVQLSSSPAPKAKAYQPLLETVKLTEEQKKEPVSRETLDKAQKQLDEGDRGGAYLTLYKELGSEQILVQAQITTYTGLWGSGALAGNSRAQDSGGERYNIPLDQFSKDIAQGTIDGIRQDLDEGGTGRLTEQQFRAIDRKVWKDKNMAELFPGNVQFWDPWNHKEDDRSAMISRATYNMTKVAARSMASLLGLPEDAVGSNSILRVGKRPAEFAKDPNYETHGSQDTRFITVVDKRTGFVEAFWDNKPKMGMVRVPQLDNKPLEQDSKSFIQRNFLYRKVGANQPGVEQADRGESNPAVLPSTTWFIA